MVFYRLRQSRWFNCMLYQFQNVWGLHWSCTDNLNAIRWRIGTLSSKYCANQFIGKGYPDSPVVAVQNRAVFHCYYWSGRKNHHVTNLTNQLTFCWVQDTFWSAVNKKQKGKTKVEVSKCCGCGLADLVDWYSWYIYAIFMFWLLHDACTLTLIPSTLISAAALSAADIGAIIKSENT